MAKNIGLKVRVNSVLTKKNMSSILETAKYVKSLEIQDYSAFYFSPIGCGKERNDLWIPAMEYFIYWNNLQRKIENEKSLCDMNIVIEKGYASWEEAKHLEIEGFTGCGGGCLNTFKNRDYLIVRCDGVCSFCYLNQYQKNSNQPKFRFRSPELLIEDIKELVEKYEIKKLTFVDDDFFGPNSYGVERAKHFFELLIENNIRLELYINVRIASVLYLISNNLLKLVADAGVKYIFIGIESYNDDILRRYKKGITTQDIDMVCNKLDEYGIYINPGMITFDSLILPHQVKNNVDLLKRIQYYDLFMFTRTLMDLPSDKQAMKNNQITSGSFKNEKTEKLYYSLVEFRDLVYPL